MWEEIAKNHRRSFWFAVLMALMLAALGFCIGMAVGLWAQNETKQQIAPLAGLAGTAVALLVWLVILLVSLIGGDGMLLSSVGAREIGPHDARILWNVVEEMTIASGLPKPPRVFIIEQDAPNAFAVGRNPKKAAVAVTTGLLRRLNRDELQGVVAHEIGHVCNQDVRFMTLAAAMVGSIVLISDVFLRSLRYGPPRRSSSRSDGKDSGGAAILFFALAIVLAILTPLFARLLYFACSRKREFLADASSALFTRYPAGLASALQKIAGSSASAGFNTAVMPLCTVSPRESHGALLGFSGLFSTHPPTDLRIKVLAGMGGQADFAAYEAAFASASGGRKCLGAQALSGASAVAVREARPDVETQEEQIAQGREALDFVARSAGYVPIACECGLRIKVPPAYARADIQCPRCGRQHSISSAA